jgi:heme exporter protein D
MNWNSFAEFADMGGYALYVWGSYVMVAAALGWEALMLAQRRRRALDDAHEQAHLQAQDTP